MDDKQKTQHLFLGGTLHGSFLPVHSPGKPIFNDRFPLVRVDHPVIGLRPCLELREIEGLTGRTWHIMQSDEIRREMLAHRQSIQLTREVYLPKEFVFRRGRRDMLYVLNGYEPPTFEILTMMREHRPELVDEDY